jgi:hypothetical protein
MLWRSWVHAGHSSCSVVIRIVSAHNALGAYRRESLEGRALSVSARLASVILSLVTTCRQSSGYRRRSRRACSVLSKQPAQWRTDVRTRIAVVGWAAKGHSSVAAHPRGDRPAAERQRLEIATEKARLDHLLSRPHPYPKQLIKRDSLIGRLAAPFRSAGRGQKDVGHGSS